MCSFSSLRVDGTHLLESSEFVRFELVLAPPQSTTSDTKEAREKSKWLSNSYFHSHSHIDHTLYSFRYKTAVWIVKEASRQRGGRFYSCFWRLKVTGSERDQGSGARGWSLEACQSMGEQG